MSFKRLLIVAVILLALGIGAAILLRSIKPKAPEIAWNASTSLRVEDVWPTAIDDLELTGLSEAIKQSLAYYGRQDPNGSLVFGSKTVLVSQVVDAFNQLLTFLDTKPTQSAMKEYLTKHFSLYTSATPKVLFTGYYIPHLYGSLVRTERFAFPIYTAPSDLVEITLDPSIKSKLPADFPVVNRGRLEGRRVVIPYFSREEIELKNRLDGKRLELLWVDSKVDLFFLHIQGSGNVELEDGTIMRVGYADKNGHPYRAVGKTLLEKGLLKKGEITMFTIKEALKSNEALVDEILNSNPSYVFFRPLDGSAVGSLNVPVTPNRSVAVDQSLFPKGALGFIQTEKPIFDSAGKVLRWDPFTRLVLNQDTGGAIRGPGRVDIFMGDGKSAEATAGITQHTGSLYFLAPK